MYFQAESNGVKYEINVRETKENWTISLKPDAGEWTSYTFTKDDYQYMDDTISFIFRDRSYLLDVTTSGVDYTVYTRGAFRTVRLYNEEKILHESLKSGRSIGPSDNLVSEMPGKIVSVFVKPGQEVKVGDPLLIMEAMKMENELRASRDGKIKEVQVKAGDTVESNVSLITFEK